MKGRCCETCNSKDFWEDEKEDTKKFGKAEETMKEEDVPVYGYSWKHPFSIIFFQNWEFYNSYGLYTHNSHILMEFKGVLCHEAFEFEETPDVFVDETFIEPFFTRRVKLFSRRENFFLYGKTGFDIFSFSELKKHMC